MTPTSYLTARPRKPQTHDYAECPTLDTHQLQALAQIAGSAAPDFLRDLLHTFEKEASRTLEALIQASRAGDAAECRRLLHFLSGGAANLGLKRLHTLCRASDQALITRGSTHTCPTATISQEYQEATAACRSWITRFKASFAGTSLD